MKSIRVNRANMKKLERFAKSMTTPAAVNKVLKQRVLAGRSLARGRRDAAHPRTPRPDGGIDKAIRYATEQALRGARFPKRRTSPLSSVIAQELAAAYAEFIEGF